MARTWIAVALATLLLQTPAHAEEIAVTTESAQGNLDGIVELENPEYLKGLKRVAITSFNVEILTYLKASEGGDLGNLISGKPNSVSVTLKGHDSSTWQPVVDDYYRKLLAQLEKAGIEVIPQEKLQELPEYKTISESSKPSPHEEDAKAGKGLYFGSAGVPLLIQDEQQVFRRGIFSGKAPEDLYMTFGSRFAAGFTTGGAQNAEFALAKKLDAHILKVRFTVVPTLLTTTKGFWVGKSVESKASLSLPTYVNRFVLYSPTGDQSKISLKAPAVGSKTVGDMKEVTSAAGTALRTVDTVGGIALGFVTGGLGGAIKAGANVAKDYDVTVDNTSFNQMLVEELSNVSQTFVARLQSGR